MKYSNKELLKLCSDMWYEVANILRKDALMHMLSIKHKAVKVVTDEELKAELIKNKYCVACYIANQNCKKCPMLEVWNYKKTDAGAIWPEPCVTIGSPYLIVQDQNNGVERLLSALKIADVAKNIAEGMK